MSTNGVFCAHGVRFVKKKSQNFYKRTLAQKGKKTPQPPLCPPEGKRPKVTLLRELDTNY